MKRYTDAFRDYVVNYLDGINFKDFVIYCKKQNVNPTKIVDVDDFNKECRFFKTECEKIFRDVKINRNYLNKKVDSVLVTPSAKQVVETFVKNAISDGLYDFDKGVDVNALYKDVSEYLYSYGYTMTKTMCSRFINETFKTCIKHEFSHGNRESYFYFVGSN